LVLRAVTPIVLFLVVLGVTLTTRGSGSLRTDPYVVAVQGDFDGAQHTLGQLSDRLRFVRSDDAAVDSVRSADLGIEVPDRLDDRLSRREVADVVVFESATTADSRAASAFLRAGLGNIHEQAVQAAVADRAPGDQGDPNEGGVNHFTFDVVDLEPSQPATRSQGAGLVAAVLLLQATMIVGATATRLLSRNNRGLLAAQLLLPFRRWHLALGKGVAELELGVIVAIPVLVLVAGFSFWTAAGRDGPLVAVADGAAVILTYLVLAITMTGLGVLVGSVSRTQEQVSLVSAVIVVVAAVIASQIIGQPVTPPAVANIVPVAGPVTGLRALLEGSGQAVWWAVGCAITLGLAALFIRMAGRRFDAERLVTGDQ
jgi:hypothetical protein